MLDYEQVLAKVRLWLLEVGSIQLQGMETQLQVDSKSTEFDLVTDIDQKSEAYILGAIRREYPGQAILSEESGASGSQSEYLWVVDPLDGTVNYAHRFPIFTISIALQHQGVTMLGAVYAPYLKEFFWAIRGRGAFGEQVSGQGTFINERRLTVAGVSELAQALVATGFPYDRALNPDNNLDYFNRMMLKIGGISRSGSAAFDLANVASGRINGYWEFKLNPWDIAAGVLLVAEAGGRVDYLVSSKGIGLIAGNPELCRRIYQELQGVNPQLSLTTSKF